MGYVFHTWKWVPAPNNYNNSAAYINFSHGNTKVAQLKKINFSVSNNTEFETGINLGILQSCLIHFPNMFNMIYHDWKLWQCSQDILRFKTLVN